MKAGMLAAAAALAIGGALTALNAAEWKTPRTPWGEPDLQGTWSSEAELTTPFERAPELGTRQWLTDQEFADRQKRTLSQLDVDNSEFDVDTADTRNAGQVGSATSPPPHWLERRQTSRRTSLVVDPPDGRVPPMTPAAQRRLAATPRGSNGNLALLNGPEDFATWDRCITRGMPAAIFPTVYNANTRIVQGPGFVAITYEMIHDTRVVPTSERPHPGAAIHQYYGDSKGRWDGETLVIDVRNFTKKTNYRGSSEGLHLTERFRRVDAGTMRYEVTFDDPQTWEKPWTAALDMIPQTSGLFEYACHEGNYALLNMLKGARAADR